MEKHQESITELAKRAVTDEYMLAEYATPEKVLEYLMDDSHFRTLANLLKETMIIAGVCPQGASLTQFINKFYAALSDVESLCSAEKPITKKTVSRWFDGTSKSIRNRDTAIKICFALQLDESQATTFLNKCGFNGFNVRIVEDVVYLYCLVKKKPMSTAKGLLNAYEAFSGAVEQDPSIQEAGEVHSGHTTVQLQNWLNDFFCETIWSTDEDFLCSFLIPNKPKFIAYSATLQKEYYLLKNTVFLNVLYDRIGEEGETISHGVFEQTDIPMTEKVVAVFSRYNGKLLSSAKERCNNDVANVVKAISEIQAICANDLTLNELSHLSAFLNEIITDEGFLKYVIESYKSAGNRLRRKTDSLLADSIMKEFPGKDSFATFENAPQVGAYGLTVRKAMVLMYFFAFAYEYTRELVSEYASPMFENCSFDCFYDSLNLLLRKCQLAPLYYANHFDWLVLRCVREFECVDPLEKDQVPLKFMSDILALSFLDERPT